MTIAHIVLFKFRADVAEAVREEFLSQIKTLKNLPCVKSQRLVVGGPSITTPIEKSKGFQYALVSYHENRAALDEYQASSEHHRLGKSGIKVSKVILGAMSFGTDDWMIPEDRALPVIKKMLSTTAPAHDGLSSIAREDEAVQAVALFKDGFLSDEGIKYLDDLSGAW